MGGTVTNCGYVRCHCAEAAHRCADLDSCAVRHTCVRCTQAAAGLASGSDSHEDCPWVTERSLAYAWAVGRLRSAKRDHCARCVRHRVRRLDFWELDGGTAAGTDLLSTYHLAQGTNVQLLTVPLGAPRRWQRPPLLGRSCGIRRFLSHALAETTADDDLVALEEALTRFAQLEPQKAELVKFRYFVGLAIDQAAAALGISPPTAKRHWVYSKAWSRPFRSSPRALICFGGSNRQLIRSSLVAGRRTTQLTS